MAYIRKLPLLMSLLAAIVVGMAGYTQKMSDKEKISKMFIVMIMFYFVGYFIREAVLSIQETVKIKDEQQKWEMEQLEKEHHEKADVEMKKGSGKGSVIDIEAKDDSGFNTEEDGFDALPIVDFIEKELNQ